MVAQSEQAFLAIAQGNAPKEAIMKILEYKTWSTSSSMARATSLEQQQAARVGLKRCDVWVVRRRGTGFQRGSLSLKKPKMLFASADLPSRQNRNYSQAGGE